ncbi:hypothetical protein QW180_26060 [Vibrio sinaloensis]|nr:hypothetical protein [Vibrio sinaloensis]
MFSNAGLLSVWCVEQTGNVEIFEALGFKVAERIESDIFLNWLTAQTLKQ